MWKFTGSTRPPFADEPGPGLESVWDYPRPPRIEPDSRVVRVEFGGVVVAETRRSLRVLETSSPPTFYLPREDVNFDLLVPVDDQTYCEWKGSASYWSLKRRPNDPVAWSYERPRSRFDSIRGFLAFYPGRVDCFLDGEPAQTQAGRFYGGWITSEVVGPFKGEPGTGHW